MNIEEKTLYEEVEEVRADYVDCLCETYSKKELVKYSEEISTCLLFCQHCENMLYNYNDFNRKIMLFISDIMKEPDRRTKIKKIIEIADAYGYWLAGYNYGKSHREWRAFMEDYIDRYIKRNKKK